VKDLNRLAVQRVTRMDNNKGFSTNLPQVCSLTGTTAITATYPRANASPPDVQIDYSDSQVPTSEDYLYVDAEYPEAISV